MRERAREARVSERESARAHQSRIFAPLMNRDKRYMSVCVIRIRVLTGHGMCLFPLEDFQHELSAEE